MAIGGGLRGNIGKVNKRNGQTIEDLKNGKIKVKTYPVYLSGVSCSEDGEPSRYWERRLPSIGSLMFDIICQDDSKNHNEFRDCCKSLFKGFEEDYKDKVDPNEEACKAKGGKDEKGNACKFVRRKKEDLKREFFERFIDVFDKSNFGVIYDVDKRVKKDEVVKKVKCKWGARKTRKLCARYLLDTYMMLCHYIINQNKGKTEEPCFLRDVNGEKLCIDILNNKKHITSILSSFIDNCKTNKSITGERNDRGDRDVTEDLRESIGYFAEKLSKYINTKILKNRPKLKDIMEEMDGKIRECVTQLKIEIDNSGNIPNSISGNKFERVNIHKDLFNECINSLKNMNKSMMTGSNLAS